MYFQIYWVTIITNKSAYIYLFFISFFSFQSVLSNLLINSYYQSPIINLFPFNSFPF